MDDDTLWSRKRVTETAIERAETAAVPWNILARACIEWLAIRRQEFTSDAFWAAMDRAGIPRPREPRANGGPFVYAARHGWIRKTGRTVQSTRERTADGAKHHTTPVPVYESLIYGGTQTLTYWPPR
jgi:hypothetical protein